MGVGDVEDLSSFDIRPIPNQIIRRSSIEARLHELAAALVVEHAVQLLEIDDHCVLLVLGLRNSSRIASKI